jgi:tetratricopeptide (TPR) repeat protein
MRADSPLRTFLEQLGWSPDRLAREINRASGTETVSAKAPYAWIKGAYPRGKVAHIVADILTRQLGEPITTRAIWPSRQHRRSQESGGVESSWLADARIGSAELRAAALQLIPGQDARCQFSDTDTTAAALDWLIGIENTDQTKTDGDDLNPEVLEMLAGRVGDLRRLDDLHGASFVVDLAIQDLRWAMTLSRECAYGRANGVRLHQLIAELAQLAGWLALDTGESTSARHLFVSALRAARTAEDCALGAYVLSCMAYQAIWNGMGEHALRLIKTACKGQDHDAPSAVRALLFSRLARAHAVLGDVRGTTNAITSSTRAWEDHSHLSTPPWGYWITPATLLGDAGRAWLDLGRHHHAEANLRRALHLLGDSHPRNRSLYLTSLAEIHIWAGDLDGAAEAVREAIQLVNQINSTRTRCQLRNLENMFAGHKGSSAAREAAEMIGYSLHAHKIG